MPSYMIKQIMPLDGVNALIIKASFGRGFYFRNKEKPLNVIH